MVVLDTFIEAGLALLRGQTAFSAYGLPNKTLLSGGPTNPDLVACRSLIFLSDFRSRFEPVVCSNCEPLLLQGFGGPNIGAAQVNAMLGAEKAGCCGRQFACFG
jgi:hypothetical protein